jgi:diguanylate cyclase (GGDEF)-like protein/putative nucleotidyltransferase with HDIG domain
MGHRAAALRARLAAGLEGAANPGTLHDPQAAARFLGLAYLGGTALALTSMALPQPPGTSVAGLFALYASAFLAGVLLLLRAQRASDWEIALALLLGSAFISLAIVFTEERTGVYSMLYVWVALESAYFLSWRLTALELAAVGACFALVLGAERPAGAEEQWLLTVGTIAVVAVLVGALKRHVARLIERLADAAQTDPLTKLRNRRGFQGVLEAELARALRTGKPVSLLVADLDHFKIVNDRLGHAGGDRALQRFAGQMQRLTRQVDAGARLGGEEFALVLPECGKHDAYLVAERLRRAVRAAFAEGTVPLTVSIGVASHPDHGHTADDLLLAGDQALYAAKQLGRDRAVLFNAETVAEVRMVESARDGNARDQLSAVLLLAETMDMRDPGAAHHSREVSRLAEATARALGLSQATVERVSLAGLLHDVGKVGVSDAVLQKPGRLDEREWAEMRQHPELGARILAGAHLEDLAEWVFAHHERMDGTGYPLGLRGEEVPLEARILAVADAYEAMRGERVYSSAMSHDAAAAELRRAAGSQFDAQVVEALLGSLAAAEGERLAGRS